MVIDLVTEDSIELDVEAKDWEEAVRKGGELLRKTGAVEYSYIDAMVNMIKKLGPYVVISRGIAFPHARPEDGALKSGISLITLKNPIEFGDEENDPIKMIISFCSIDAEGHLHVLSELVDFLRDDVAVKAVEEAKNKEEVIEILRGIYKKVEC